MNRIVILLEKKIISQDTFDICFTIDEKMEVKYKDSKEKYDLFLTHLAMAIERNKEDEKTSVNNEVENMGFDEHIYINEARNTLKIIYNYIPFPLHKSEDIYILIHLCNILGES